MARALVIGYGNRYRSDDGVGCRVAEKLQRTVSHPDITIIACQQLTPELAQPVSQSEVVVLIDAARQGTAGAIKCEAIHPGANAIGSHQLSASALLTLARELYGGSPRAYLLSVCGESFADGEGMSSKVTAALDPLLARVKSLISMP